MNRRKFLGGLFGVGAVAAGATAITDNMPTQTNCIDTGNGPDTISFYGATPTKTVTLVDRGVWSDGFNHDMRMKYQEELSQWLANKVDESAFKMMTGK